MSALFLFRLKDSEIFPGHMFKSNVVTSVKPAKWWQLIAMKQQKSEKKLPAGFCKLISNLHCCPASSGAIERVFSTFGLVWNKLRNSLGSERAEKLVKVYRFLNTES